MIFDAQFVSQSLAQNAVAPSSLNKSVAANERKYLLVVSRGVLCAIEMSCVREVHLLPEIAPLPQSPRFVTGVFNLRGVVVPLVDLAIRLGKPPRRAQLSDGLVIVESERLFALAVDEVREIIAISPSQIEAPPLNIEYSIVAGMTHQDGEIVMILNVSRLLDFDGSTQDHAPFETDDHDTEDDERAIFRERARRLATLQSDAQTGSIVGFQTAQESSVAIARVVLGGEVCGVRLTQVREFCALQPFAKVPCCPPHIVGQMNLRGDIVTLLDVRAQLGFSSSAFSSEVSEEATVETVVVVASLGDNAGLGDDLLGILVEKVHDVIAVRESDLRAVPPSSRAPDKYSGAVLHNEKLMVLLDLPAILGDANLVVDEVC